MEFEIVDVFTETRFGGNQLAVLPDAGELDEVTMQSIAREFGFSETVFVGQVDDSRAAIRIFTPGGELPFAGHPCVGAAVVLGRRGWATAGSAAMSVPAGEVPVTIEFDADGERVGADVLAPRPLTERPGPSPRTVAACCGLDPGELSDVVVAGVGVDFVFAEVADPAALRRAVADAAALRDAGAEVTTGLYLYCPTATVSARGPATPVLGRMFSPLLPSLEDAATGSAVAALAGLWCRRRGTPVRLDVRQGESIGRPARLNASAQARPGQGIRCGVGGGVIAVASGSLHLAG